jgi:rhodanese-related sulfurtransferase
MDYEISVEEVKQLMDQQQPVTLLDVREDWEYQTANIAGAELIPMAQVPDLAAQKLSPQAHIVVYCHHGVRSLRVAAWLRRQGFSRVQSMAGGIDSWSRLVDSSVPRY